MADGWPVKSPDATLKQLESELGSQIQALEAAALGRDPDALLAVARELETSIEAMNDSGVTRLDGEHPQDQPQVVQALERLQADLRKTFAVVAQRRDQTGAALRALGTEPATTGYGDAGATTYAPGRVLGHA